MAYREGRTSFLQTCGQYLGARNQGDAPILMCIQAALIVLNRLFIKRKEKDMNVGRGCGERCGRSCKDEKIVE